VRWPASSAACFTQFRIAWAEGSNCRPSSSGVRPFRTSSTSRARNSGEYGRWLFGIVVAPFCPNDGVSTKPGQLQTLKYRPDFPDRFGAYEDAEAFCQRLFPWYNTEHRHGALGLMTPHDIHYGLAAAKWQQRVEILRAA
jgi:hypothetical protein